jgi:hypothetical protein
MGVAIKSLMLKDAGAEGSWDIATKAGLQNISNIIVTTLTRHIALLYTVFGTEQMLRLSWRNQACSEHQTR